MGDNFDAGYHQHYYGPEDRGPSGQTPERPFLHFDEPDKSCFAGYGCTDDCPVSAYARERRQPLPQARLHVPWLTRARAHVRLTARRVLAAVVCIIVGALAWAAVGLCLRSAENAAASAPVRDLVIDVLTHAQTILKEHP